VGLGRIIGHRIEFVLQESPTRFHQAQEFGWDKEEVCISLHLQLTFKWRLFQITIEIPDVPNESCQIIHPKIIP
jgi:hypothetical protein